MGGVRTAFALAGLGGNNAYGAGFLAAAQQVQRQRNDETSGDTVPAERARRGFL
jgi:hypothetical protein